MLHHRRKNTTIVFGIGGSTSIVLNGLSIGVGQITAWVLYPQRAMNRPTTNGRL